MAKTKPRTSKTSPDDKPVGRIEGKTLVIDLHAAGQGPHWLSGKRKPAKVKKSAAEVDEAWLTEAEADYPGFRKTLHHYETQPLPPCPTCGSAKTATTSTGIVGYSITMAAATTRIKLVPNGHPADFYCNACGKFFEESTKHL